MADRDIPAARPDQRTSGYHGRPRPMIGMLMPAIHDLHGEQWLGAVEAATAHECDLICFCGGELEQSERSGQANVIYDLATAESLDALVVWTSALATKVGRERLEKFFSES